MELKGKASLDTINFLTKEQLLQRAIRETYGVDFAGKNLCLPNDLTNKMTGRVKSLDYKLIVKRGGKYYLCRNNVLTEFYYVCTSGFLFPNEPGYCGIYMPFPSQIYTPDYIENQLFKNGGFSSLAQNYTSELSGKLYCSGFDTLNNLRLTNHWMRSPRGGNTGPYKYYYKSLQTSPYIVRNGSNIFQFLERVGIINGNYEFYLFDAMRNRQTDSPIDTAGVTFDFEVISINKKQIKEFSAWYQQKSPPVVRSVEN